jgi:aspartate oxidase
VTPPVAVIGSGAAGMMAAIHASAERPVRLFTDGPLARSNTAMAQGGLQYPLTDEASLQAFLEDILASARTELDLERVSAFVRGVAPMVEELEAWGLVIDRAPNGEVIRKSAGGLSRPRIISVGDHIGSAIIRVLRKRLSECDVDVRAHTPIVGVVPDSGGLRLTTADGQSEWFGAVVACSGGLTYQRSVETGQATTNPANANHRLYEVLRDLGLARVHEDFYQYHPFGIVEPDTGIPMQCVPETIVNHGVALLDVAGNEVCPMGKDRLAVVEASFAAAAANRTIAAADGRRGLRLTISRVPRDVLEEQFHKVHRLLERAGQPNGDVLVVPALHYHLGGFVVDTRGATAVPGLYLAGEMVGGLHGKNRLMGNGLTDSLVHGRIAGRAAAAFAAG